MKSILNKILPDLSGAVAVSFLTIAGGSAFGVLTGLGAQAGILSMVVASLFGWLFGGVSVKALGPTGPTASIMLTTIIAIQALSIDISAVFFILIAAGLLLVIIGFVPLQRVIALIPNVATAVFINGIALIIIDNQVRKIISFQSPDNPARFWDTGIALGSLIFLLIWPKISKRFQMTPIGRLLSGSLLVMIIGGIINFSFNNPSEGMMVEGMLFSDGFPLQINLLNQIPIDFLLINSAKIAFIIFFVTVVSARALMITKSSDYKAELRNIGIANIATATVGGVASSIGFIRSKIMKDNGGHSVMSGIYLALLVLILLVCAKPLLKQIPVAVFIGILISAVWGSMDWQFLKNFKSAPRKNIISFFLVLFGSLAMLWVDQTIVIITASILWYVLNRIPSLSEVCNDIEDCPIEMQNTDS